MNRPVVLWVEGGQLYAKRWSGTAWDLVLGPVAYSSGGYALAIGPGDALAVAVGGGVTGFAGFHVDTSVEVSLAFEGSQPVAAYVSAGAVQVVRPGLPPSSFYAALGGPLGTDAHHPTVLYRPGGPPGQQLVVAYEEHASPAGMRVLAWDGSSWSSISTVLGTLSSSFWGTAQLVANGSGAAAVCWTELDPPAARLIAKRYNR
jgi:hypothetical protein